MKTINAWPTAWVLGFVLSVLTTGCMPVTRPAQFYVLSPIGSTASRQADRQGAGRVVALGPLTLPEALRRPQIVTRIGDNQLEISEFHRWAGSLEQDMLRVVAEDLSFLLSADQVVVYPWEAGCKPDMQVKLDVSRLDGRLGGEAVLHATWTIWPGRREASVLARGKTVHSEPAGKGGYDALVAAYSQLLGALSRDIAAAIATP